LLLLMLWLVLLLLLMLWLVLLLLLMLWLVLFAAVNAVAGDCAAVVGDFATKLATKCGGRSSVGVKVTIRNKTERNLNVSTGKFIFQTEPCILLKQSMLRLRAEGYSVLFSNIFFPTEKLVQK